MKNGETVARKRIDAQLRAAVIRGVRLMDKRDPYWSNGENTPPAIEGMVGHIDLATLNLSSSRYCVLGQRHAIGQFGGGMKSLDLTPNEIFWHGFDAEYNREEKCSILTELWASVIQSRRYPRRKIASDPWVKKANKSWVRA